MYNSSFTSDMVNELKRDYGSILSVDDFLNYTVRVREVLISQFSGLQVLGASPPSSGAVVAMVLNILEGEVMSMCMAINKLSNWDSSPRENEPSHTIIM